MLPAMSNINYTKTRVVSVMLLLLAITASINAQQNNTMYYMDRLPQSMQLNPAIQPRCNFYIQLYGIELNAGNALSFNDVFVYKTATDSTYFRPGQSNMDWETFSGKLKKRSDFLYETRVDLPSFGFRVNNNYFSFATTERIDVNTDLPYDLPLGIASMLINFNQASFGQLNREFNYENIRISASNYLEFALGYSREINERFTFGLRGKLLFGMANINTKSFNVNGTTGIEAYKINADIEINTSIPTMTIGYDSKGKASIDSVKFSDIESGWNGIKPILLNRKNLGFALDFGIIVKPIDMLSFSASIIDLGFIRWKSNVNNFTGGGSFDYYGYDDKIEYEDTLKKVFTFETNHNSYITSLSGKLYTGANLQLAKWVGVGFLSRFQLINQNIRSQYSFSLNLSPGQALSTSFSYSIIEGVADNLGFGLSLKGGPLNWYWIFDRIPITYNTINSIPVPAYAKSINFRMGLNLMFGCTRNKKLKKDKPLVEVED